MHIDKALDLAIELAKLAPLIKILVDLGRQAIAMKRRSPTPSGKEHRCHDPAP